MGTTGGTYSARIFRPVMLQRTDYDVIDTCFCISLCTSPMIGQFS